MTERKRKPKYPFNDWGGPLEGFDEFVCDVIEKAKQQFGIDQDGDCPVNIHFTDRTKFEPLHHFDVPYEHKARTQEDMQEIEDALMSNLSMAMERYRHFLMLKKDIARRPKPLVNRG